MENIHNVSSTNLIGSGPMSAAIISASVYLPEACIALG